LASRRDNLVSNDIELFKDGDRLSRRQKRGIGHPMKSIGVASIQNTEQRLSSSILAEAKEFSSVFVYCIDATPMLPSSILAEAKEFSSAFVFV
jgi:hypothetical protein